MSLKMEKRHMADGYGFECKRIGNGRVQFKVTGNNKSGTRIQFTIDTDFYNWRCVASQLKKAWTEERNNRTREIESIDSSMPKEES